MSRIFFLFIFSMSLSCSKRIDVKAPDAEAFKKIEVSERASDILVPKAVWNEIELQGLEGENYVRVKKKQEVKSDDSDWSLDNTGSLVFTDLVVQIWEKSKNILIEPNMEFHFPLGGGEIDLSQYVTRKKGTFFVKIFFAENPEDIKTVTAHFISNTKKRVVSGDSLSDGCQSVANITSFFNSDVSSKGFALNTTDDRFLGMIGGSLVISHKKNKQIYISQITFKDKEKKRLFCEPKALQNQKDS